MYLSGAVPRWQTSTCRSDTGADCSVVPVVVPWSFLVKHYKHAVHELRRDAFGVPHEAAVAEQFLRRLHQPMHPQAHCHILELCRIVGPRDTCAVPRHRARHPLLLSIPATCSCRHPDSQTLSFAIFGCTDLEAPEFMLDRYLDYISLDRIGREGRREGGREGGREGRRPRIGIARAGMCKTRPAGRVRPATRFCPAREMFLSYNGNRPAASHRPPLHYTINYGIESLGCLPLHRLMTNVINNVRFFDNALLNA